MAHTPATEQTIMTETEQCQKFLAIVEKITSIPVSACIKTKFGDMGQQRTFIYLKNPMPSLQEEIDFINEFQGRLPVTDSISIPLLDTSIVEGTFETYYQEHHANNPLVDKELHVLQYVGYWRTDSYYFAIPYPIADNAVGLFFLLAQNQDQYREFKPFLGQISAEIKKSFDM